jgi:hypothetical protein
MLQQESPYDASTTRHQPGEPGAFGMTAEVDAVIAFQKEQSQRRLERYGTTDSVKASLMMNSAHSPSTDLAVSSSGPAREVLNRY